MIIVSHQTLTKVPSLQPKGGRNVGNPLGIQIQKIDPGELCKLRGLRFGVTLQKILDENKSVTIYHTLKFFLAVEARIDQFHGLDLGTLGHVPGNDEPPCDQVLNGSDREAASGREAVSHDIVEINQRISVKKLLTEETVGRQQIGQLHRFEMQGIKVYSREVIEVVQPDQGGILGESQAECAEFSPRGKVQPLELININRTRQQILLCELLRRESHPGSGHKAGTDEILTTYSPLYEPCPGEPLGGHQFGGQQVDHR